MPSESKGGKRPWSRRGGDDGGRSQAKRSCGSGVGVGVTVVAVVVVVGVVVVVDGVGVGGLLLQLSFLWPMLAVDRTDTHTPTQRHRHRNIHTYTHIWPLASSLRKAPFNNGERTSTMGNGPKCRARAVIRTSSCGDTDIYDV